MSWRRLGAAGLLSLLLNLPMVGYAQIFTPLPESQATIVRIEQIAKATVGTITNHLYHQPELAQSTTSIAQARAVALRQITETVNGFKAQAEVYLTSHPQRLATGERIKIQQAIRHVEFTAQQAIDTIEEAASRPIGQKSIGFNLNTNHAHFFRSGLPASSAKTIFPKSQVAPPLTAAYAKSGSRPFVPLSPNIGGAVYRVPNALTSPSKAHIFDAIGLAVGGYLGMRHLFNGSAWIRINKFSPHDTQNYVFTVIGERESYQQVPVPNFLDGIIEKRIRPGNYKVFYKPVDQLDLPDGLQQYSYYPIQVLPGDVWCLHVPRPPIRCY